MFAKDVHTHFSTTKRCFVVMSVVYYSYMTETFYLTFGQRYPWRYGWVEVEAVNYEMARKKVEEIFGKQWAWLYNKDQFNKKDFPAGKLGETIK